MIGFDGSFVPVVKVLLGAAQSETATAIRGVIYPLLGVASVRIGIVGFFTERQEVIFFSAWWKMHYQQKVQEP